jgi:hypothetical protein
MSIECPRNLDVCWKDLNKLSSTCQKYCFDNISKWFSNVCANCDGTLLLSIPNNYISKNYKVASYVLETPNNQSYWCIPFNQTSILQVESLQLMLQKLIYNFKIGIDFPEKFITNLMSTYLSAYQDNLDFKSILQITNKKELPYLSKCVEIMLYTYIAYTNILEKYNVEYTEDDFDDLQLISKFGLLAKYGNLFPSFKYISSENSELMTEFGLLQDNLNNLLQSIANVNDVNSNINPMDLGLYLACKDIENNFSPICITMHLENDLDDAVVAGIKDNSITGLKNNINDSEIVGGLLGGFFNSASSVTFNRVNSDSYNSIKFIFNII